MGISIRVAIVLVNGFICVRMPAQDRATNPVAGQIREQEMATARAPGNRDGKAWLKLAILRQDAARYRDSEHAYRKAMALLKSGDRATLADAMDHLGTMYAECGEFSKAERLERKALDIREHEHDVPGIGISHMHLSVLLLGKREFSSAEAEAAMAARILIPEQSGPAPHTTASPEDKMSALIGLSLVECARGACRSAIPQLRYALSIAHMNYIDNSIPVGFIDFLLGYAHWKSGDNHTAEDLMRNGTRELSTQLGWGHPMYVRAMKQFGMFLSQTGHTTEAQEIRARIARFERAPETIDVQSLLFR